MNSLMESDQRFAHHGRHCQAKPKKVRPRHLHQSTLHFGETAPCYITTHNQVPGNSLWSQMMSSLCCGLILSPGVCQSYSGRSADGRPLHFHLRDPSFPSQHQTWLDLSDITAPLQWPLRSLTKEVHGHEQIRPVRLQRCNVRTISQPLHVGHVGPGSYMKPIIKTIIYYLCDFLVWH